MRQDLLLRARHVVDPNDVLTKRLSAEPDAVLRCWQGGCIIRADLLKDFRKAYAGRSYPRKSVDAPFYCININ